MIDTNLIVAGSLLGAGASGALVKEILVGGFLKLPEIKDGKVWLGFIGSMIVGATVGYLVDHSALMAFFAGYTGFSAATALIEKKIGQTVISPAEAIAQAVAKPDVGTLTTDPTKLNILNIIKAAADKHGINYNLAVAVARCESGLNAKARNTNKDGSTDRGLYQINDKWHPDVTTPQADDPEFAANWFCKAAKDGNLHWWNASKKCWLPALPAGQIV